MINPGDFVQELSKKNITFFTGVPGSLLKEFCHYIQDNVPKEKNVTTANEGSAVSLGAGHYLATGHPALVYLQNTGQGNIIHPLLSLNDSIVYGIPTLLLIGWRGEPGTEDAPQHLKQGEVTLEMLKTLEIDFSIISKDTTNKDISTILRRSCEYLEASQSYALVVEEGTFSPYRISKESKDLSVLTREEAISTVNEMTGKDAFIVSSAGMISRELYDTRKKNKETHDHDFLVLGSMGHASQVAAGIALIHPAKKIFCYDGDGALIMQMGNMTMGAHLKLSNFTHIVFNNGAYESAGCAPSVGGEISFTKIAEGCGYTQVNSVQTKAELTKALKEMMTKPGPSFLEIRIKKGMDENLGRPDKPLQELMKDFMKALKG
jgi:phosphonopyruvate decarboxylase